MMAWMRRLMEWAADFAMRPEGGHTGCIGQDNKGSETVISIGVKGE